MSKPRAKIELELKKKARKLFEAGVDMFDIHQELKINLGSLYNISSKENWEKGKRKEIIHYLETEKELEELRKLKKRIKDEYKELTTENRVIIKELQLETKITKDGEEKRSLVKSRAEALSNYSKAIATTYEIDKELYDIRTPEEEIKIATEKLRYESIKKALNGEIGEEDTVEI